MNDIAIDIGSVVRGIRAMKRGHSKPAQWSIDRIYSGGFWLCFWTPSWHQGRGPYFSLGLGWFRIVRGY